MNYKILTIKMHFNIKVLTIFNSLLTIGVLAIIIILLFALTIISDKQLATINNYLQGEIILLSLIAIAIFILSVVDPNISLTSLAVYLLLSSIASFIIAGILIIPFNMLKLEILKTKKDFSNSSNLILASIILTFIIAFILLIQSSIIFYHIKH